MQRSVTYLLTAALSAALAGTLSAQSNTVPGLDGRLDSVDSLTYWGRRGAAYPGGEIGMSMGNTMCNPGTVNIPWQAAMQPNHPKFGFLIARESGGRMVQISDYGYCKHAFVSTNGNGSCGTCQNPGTGSLMGVNCSDTYGSFNNAGRDQLGPATELDPWLGTWAPVGSYFDVGDPQTGTGPADGNRSLITSGFDEVKNRVTVKESDLLVAGARYFFGIHLMHQGEAVANRGDNLASRGFAPAWDGTQWTIGGSSIGQVHGSILQHWQGATLAMAGNGGDDGRFVVAVVVTTLGGGMYHYEYAVHNIDNNRGGASFRIPVTAGATTTNFGFRDIDSDALNEWGAARVGNEIVFAAAANNPLNWNSIYNFWFDCDIAPGNGSVLIDEARVGSGLLTVAVGCRAPNGLPDASAVTVGTGCGGSWCNTLAFYETFPGSPDLANSGLSMTLNGGSYQVSDGAGSYVAPTAASTNLNLGDDTGTTINLPFALPILGGSTTTLWVCSNGFVTVGNGGASYTPSAAGMLGGPVGWYPLWKDLNPAAAGSGGVFVDSSAAGVRITWQDVYVYGTTSPNTFQLQFLPNGTVHYLWQSLSGTSGTLVGWTAAGAPDPGPRDISATRATGWNVCSSLVPNLALSISNRPLLGTTVQFTTSNIPAGSPFGAVLLNLGEQSPPQDLGSIGMSGCWGYVVSAGASTMLFLAPGPSQVTPYGIVNNAAFLGLSLTAQSFTFSPPLTPLGAISSNGIALILGV